MNKIFSASVTERNVSDYIRCITEDLLKQIQVYLIWFKNLKQIKHNLLVPNIHEE